MNIIFKHTSTILNIFLLFTINTLTISCRKNLHEDTLQKIEIFERNEKKYFSNIRLQALRNSQKQKPLEYQMSYQNTFPTAIIQTSPEHKIFRNFQQDTIGEDILKVIDSLKIRGMYNVGETTQLEFWHIDEYIILYRNQPYNEIPASKEGKQIDVAKNWKYFTIKKNGDN